MCMSDVYMLCFLAQNKQRKQLKCSSQLVFGNRMFVQLFAGVLCDIRMGDSCSSHFRYRPTATTIIL